MNRLGVYDVDAAFDKMSLQTAEEFGLDAILERLVRAAREAAFAHGVPSRRVSSYF